MTLVIEDNYAEAMQWLENCPKLIVDTETTGLHPWEGDRVAGIAIRGGDRSYYFPYRHGMGPNLSESKIRDMCPILSDANKQYTGFNYDFDVQMLFREGIPMPSSFRDPMLSAQLLNEHEPTYQLKRLCDKYRGTDSSSAEQELYLLLRERGLSRGSNQDKGSLWKLASWEVEPYACADVELTEWLEDFHRPALERWGIYHLWEELCYYSWMITESEITGIQLDINELQRQSEMAEPEAESRKQRLREMFDDPNLNPNSPKQLSRLTGLHSTARKTLERLKDQEWPTVLLEYRGWSKARSTYYDPYLRLMDADHQLHPNINMIGTVGPRLSVSRPNLQAVPRQTETYPVKDCFVSRHGYVWVEIDMSQAEMRAACHYAKETRMGKILKSGGDMHAATRLRMLDEGVNIDRDDAKRLNFSILYGIGQNSLSENLDITKERARRLLTAYHSAFPGFRQLYKQLEYVAEQRGYIRMFTGRLRHYGDAYNAWEYHKAMSNLIQGTVGEMIRVAQIRIRRELPEIRQLLQVHDSIIAEVPEDRWQSLVIQMAEIMEDFPLFDPAPIVEIKVGKRWGKMKTISGFRRMSRQERDRSIRTSIIPKQFWKE